MHCSAQFDFWENLNLIQHLYKLELYSIKGSKKNILEAVASLL